MDTLTLRFTRMPTPEGQSGDTTKLDISGGLLHTRPTTFAVGEGRPYNEMEGDHDLLKLLGNSINLYPWTGMVVASPTQIIFVSGGAISPEVIADGVLAIIAKHPRSFKVETAS